MSSVNLNYVYHHVLKLFLLIPKHELMLNEKTNIDRLCIVVIIQDLLTRLYSSSSSLLYETPT